MLTGCRTANMAVLARRQLSRRGLAGKRGTATKRKVVSWLSVVAALSPSRLRLLVLRFVRVQDPFPHLFFATAICIFLGDRSSMPRLDATLFGPKWFTQRRTVAHGHPSCLPGAYE